MIACEQLDDVVLVGTSYAGMVISGVADRITERIGSLIYLNAALPANGGSICNNLTSGGRSF